MNYHTYSPNMVNAQLTSTLEKMSKLKLLILMECVKTQNISSILATMRVYGFKERKVILAVITLKNDGWLMEESIYATHISTNIKHDVESRRA